MTWQPMRQAQLPWGSCRLGNGPATIGLGGCLEFALLHSAIELGTRTSLDVEKPPLRRVDPVAFNDECTRNGCFLRYDREREIWVPGGDNLVVHLAAPLLGLTAPYELRRTMDDPQKPATLEQLRERIDDAFDAGGVAILHVDHDSTRPKGDAAADHFIVATSRWENDEGLVTVDSANGKRAETLAWPSLEGPAGWGDRTYRVRGVRPVLRR